MHGTNALEKPRIKATSTGLRRWISPCISSVLSLLAMSVHGQSQSSDTLINRAYQIVPRVSLRETWTDNVGVSAGGRQSDQITEISPGIVMTASGAHVNGYLDYSVNKINYSKNSTANQLQNSLNAVGTLEAVDNFLFVDVSGSISQQLISALGNLSPIDSTINDNKTEVSNFRISPSIRGRFNSFANYEARLSRSFSDSASSTRSGVGQTDGFINLSGDTAIKGLGWSVNTSRQSVSFSNGRPTEADLSLLGIAYVLTPQVSLNANLGIEANNYTSYEKEKSTSSGVGINWRQSERTTLSASVDERSYARTHRLNFEHRTGRTAWTLSDTKSVATSPSQTTLGSIGTVYDILFSQFASLEPNPVSRAQLVNAYLQINNLSANVRVLTPFLTTAQNIARRQDVLIALLGVRSTVTLIASRTKSQRLDSITAAIDDFSTEATIEQQGLSINYSHRLSPEMNISVLNSWQKVNSNQGRPGEKVTLLSLNITRSFIKSSSVSAGYRRASFSGLSEPSSETAFTVNLNVLF